MFLVIPTSYLVVGSFRDQAGHFTLQNYADLTRPITANAYQASIEISLVTAILGGVLGFLLAYAVISGGRSPLSTRPSKSQMIRSEARISSKASPKGLTMKQSSKPGTTAEK